LVTKRSFASSRPAPFAERYDAAGRLRLTPLCPSLHQLPALFQNVRPAIGPLNPSADLMPHGLLDHRVRECRHLLGPRPESRPEAVGGDRPAGARIEPLLLARRSCASWTKRIQDCWRGHAQMVDEASPSLAQASHLGAVGCSAETFQTFQLFKRHIQRERRGIAKSGLKS
jgi:hypothetical protein